MPSTPDTRTARSRRCFHRVMSGLERGGELRFLTLTSSPGAPQDIQKSWRALYMRMQRRGLITGYIKVPELTKAGRLHYHILFRGHYMSQKWISAMWSQIHQSPVVDIRAFRPHGSKAKIGNYMAKYMSKDGAGHYSWSWFWVWPGFCRHWQAFKRYHRNHLDTGAPGDFPRLLRRWHAWLQDKLIVDIPGLYLDAPPDQVFFAWPDNASLKIGHPAYNLEVARWKPATS